MKTLEDMDGHDTLSDCTVIKLQIHIKPTMITSFSSLTLNISKYANGVVNITCTSPLVLHIFIISITF